jgi:hypothetical protein
VHHLLDLIAVDITVLRLEGPADRADAQLAAAIIEDAIWAAARAEDRLEHVYVSARTWRQAVGVVLFHRSAYGAAGTARALDLCRRAVASAPSLAGWRAGLPSKPEACRVDGPR